MAIILAIIQVIKYWTSCNTVIESCTDYISEFTFFINWQYKISANLILKERTKTLWTKICCSDKWVYFLIYDKSLDAEHVCGRLENGLAEIMLKQKGQRY